MGITFVAGWIERMANFAETADSDRVGHMSDICVAPSTVDKGSFVCSLTISLSDQVRRE
jgi:hypothetical protein